MDTLNVEILTFVVAAAWSFFFAYFPWVKDWFEALDPKKKPLVNAGALLVCAVIYLALFCNANLACLAENWKATLVIYVKALIENQGTYLLFIRQEKQEDQLVRAQTRLIMKWRDDDWKK